MYKFFFYLQVFHWGSNRPVKFEAASLNLARPGRGKAVKVQIVIWGGPVDLGNIPVIFTVDEEVEPFLGLHCLIHSVAPSFLTMVIWLLVCEAIKCLILQPSLYAWLKNLASLCLLTQGLNQKVFVRIFTWKLLKIEAGFAGATLIFY